VSVRTVSVSEDCVRVCYFINGLEVRL
jgi:hypothetical protein